MPFLRKIKLEIIWKIGDAKPNLLLESKLVIIDDDISGAKEIKKHAKIKDKKWVEKL
jgi:hypothetical protein